VAAIQHAGFEARVVVSTSASGGLSVLALLTARIRSTRPWNVTTLYSSKNATLPETLAMARSKISDSSMDRSERERALQAAGEIVLRE
jgi:hypothetical protein